MAGPDKPPNQEQAIDTVLDAVLDLPAAERLEQAKKICQGQPEVWAEVRKILTTDDMAGDFLEHSAAPASTAEPALTPVEPFVIGERIGPWEVVGRIGQGGMGEVLEVRRADGQYEMRAALKRLQQANADQVERLQRERQILAALQHPNIAALLDGGVDASGRPWMVMEYVPGQQLDHWAKQATEAEKLAVLAQLCAALSHAHGHLVIHRDIKPANVLVGSDGQAKLLDFGIAKLISALSVGDQTQALATPNYAAPEQLLGEPVTVRTDVYGLGACLYALLTGQPPLQLDALSLPRLVDQVRHARPKPPSEVVSGISADLEAICLRCLEKEPAQRYSSVDELSQDLRRLEQGFPVLARSPRRRDYLRSFIHRHRLATISAAVFLLTIVTGLFALSWQTQLAVAERDLARREAQRLHGLRNAVNTLFRTAADSGENLSARELFQRSAAKVESDFASDPATSGALLQMLGDLHLQNEDYPAARALLEKALALPQDELAPVVIADTHLGIAHLAFRDRDFAKTREHLDRAAETWRDAPHLYRVEVMQTATLEAQLARAEGQLDHAVELLQQAAREAGQHWGEQHPETAAVVVNLAANQYYAGQIGAAIESSERAWNIYRAINQDHSPDALNLLANWGVFALRAGRPREAELRLSEALELRTELYGASAAQAILMKNLGLAHLANGREQDGLDLLEQSQWMAERYAGAQSHIHAASSCKLAWVRLRGNDAAAARQALALLPEEVYQRATHWGEYCRALRTLASEPLQQRGSIVVELEALAARGKRGRNYRAELLELLGQAALRQQQPAVALGHFREALADKLITRPARHYESLNLQLRQADALAAMGEAAKATQLRRASLDALSQAVGPDHPLVLAEYVIPNPD